jgi:hypothetical protein
MPYFLILVSLAAPIHALYGDTTLTFDTACRNYGGDNDNINNNNNILSYFIKVLDSS